MNMKTPASTQSSEVTNRGLYLRALMHCFNAKISGVERLPKKDQKEFLSTPQLEQPLEPKDLLFDMTDQIGLWNVNQVKDLLIELPDLERRRCVHYLPSQLADLLVKDERFASLQAWKEPFANAFFKRRFLQFLTKRAPLPQQLLSPSQYNYLLSFSPEELLDFCDLMAIHTLIVPLKHMIEQEKRTLLKKALSAEMRGHFLLSYLRHLQSDINEQTAPIAAIQFPLYRWNWKIETFGALIKRFGIYCLANLLKEQQSEFLDHLVFKLDPEIVDQFCILNKREFDQTRDRELIRHSLQRLAAKAGDFILSQKSSRQPTSSSAQTLSPSP